MATDKQIAANKENAKKAGVKTSKGKASSSRNSLKHGILSRHLYIPTGQEDDLEEFAQLRHAFFTEMCPVGLIETLLVDRLFSTFWRLKRLHIAETGMIRSQIEPHFLRYTFDKMESFGKARVNAESTFFQRIRTSQGCAFMASCMEGIIEHIETKGFPLPENLIRGFDRELGAREGFFKTECISIADYAIGNRAKEPMSDEEVKQVTEMALAQAKGAREFFKGLADILEWDEEDERKADQMTKMIPQLEQLDRIQRYDAHLQRVMLQTLHELQRVQSARLGRPAPMAAALDVTVDHPNGFVS